VAPGPSAGVESHGRIRAPVSVHAVYNRLDLPPHAHAMTHSQLTFILSAAALSLASRSPGAEPPTVQGVVGQFCVTCHDADTAKGGLDLSAVASADVARHPDVWEKVV